MEKRLDISVVVPLYNEEESLPELTAWIDRVARENGLSYEIVFVDDGSTDGSWETLERLKEHYPALRAIGFARNYGKSAALYCGFAAAEGDVVFTMDADLQDSPDEIPDMRRMILEEGYDMVSGWKLKRHDPIGKRWPSKFFNWTARTVSGIKLHDFNCGLKAYRRKVVKSIEVYGEMHRYIPILAKEAGFRRIGEKVVCHRARKYGSSKFGMERMVKGYLDLITVSFLSHFGRSPMYFFRRVGDAHVPAGRLLDDLDHRRQALQAGARPAAAGRHRAAALLPFDASGHPRRAVFPGRFPGRADRPQRLRPQQIPDRQEYLTNRRL